LRLLTRSGSAHPPSSTLLPYTTLFRSPWPGGSAAERHPAAAPRAICPNTGRSRSPPGHGTSAFSPTPPPGPVRPYSPPLHGWGRSEEHTSELQSRENLVCRLLLEKKKQ